jgi:tetratricopeptide (TPR) repeat protein
MPMPGYNYIENDEGNVCGVWLSNHDSWFVDSGYMPGLNTFEAMASLDGHFTPLMKAQLRSHNYRKVPNPSDDKGWYIMFGPDKAPCEESDHYNTAREHYKKAEKLFSAEQFNEAIEEYKLAIALRPDYGRAYMGLGDCYYLLKDYDSAIGYFEKSISYKPYAPTYRYLGDAYLQKGELNQAIEAYKKSVAMDPDYEPAKISLRLSQARKNNQAQGLHRWYNWLLRR